MRLPPASAKRFQPFIAAALTAADYPHRELRALAGLKPERRSALDRAFKPNKSPLKISEARRVIEVLAIHPVLDIDPNIVWEWVMCRIPMPESIQELLISAAIQPRRLPAQTAALAEFEANSTEQIGLSTIPKLSALPEEAALFVHGNCTRPLRKFRDRILNALNSFYRIRHQARNAGHQRPARQTFLHFQSDLNQIREGTGLFAGMTADLRAETIRTYAADAINRGHQIGILCDLESPVLRERRARYRFDALFILDTNHIYKVHQGGLLRSTVEPVDEPGKAFIAKWAAELRELKGLVTHGWKESQQKNALEAFMPA